MKIVRSDKYKYLGWSDGYHKFQSLQFDSIEFVREAKYIDVSTNAVLMLKDDGTIEPSYSSSVRLDKSTLDSVVMSFIVP